MAANKNCPNARLSVISSSDSDAISEVQLKNCPGQSDSYSIYRLVWGQKFATLLLYNLESGQLTPGQREAAIRTLSGFTGPGAGGTCGS